MKNSVYSKMKNENHPSISLSFLSSFSLKLANDVHGSNFPSSLLAFYKFFRVLALKKKITSLPD